MLKAEELLSYHGGSLYNTHHASVPMQVLASMGTLLCMTSRTLNSNGGIQPSARTHEIREMAVLLGGSTNVASAAVYRPARILSLFPQLREAAA